MSEGTTLSIRARNVPGKSQPRYVRERLLGFGSRGVAQIYLC